jgi:hypothetical protein
MTDGSNQTIVIRHHGMRHVTQDEVIPALEAIDRPPKFLIDEEVDTAQFATEPDGVNWDQSHGEIWKRSQELAKTMHENPGAHLAYFGGYPEVPHVVALAAYLGEIWPIDVFDLRGTSDWRWPSSEKSLALETIGVPRDPASTSGAAVLRLEISASIDESLIRGFVTETEEVAHVRIRPTAAAQANDSAIVPEGSDASEATTTLIRGPGYGSRINSPADVKEVADAVREAINGILESRPNVSSIHLFVAAPVSAAFATGRELRIRNGPPVQTYRHRRNTQDGRARFSAAILLKAGGPDEADVPVTEEEARHAAELRTDVWGEALREVEDYVDFKRRNASEGDGWYEKLEPREELTRVRPFPSLPPLERIYPNGKSTVDVIPLEPPNYFGYQRANRVWRVSDRFLLRLNSAFQHDISDLRTLVRMFMLHEMSHLAHGIVKGKVEEVGKFPNVLEHVDYTADLYAILHELNRELITDPSLPSDYDTLKTRVSSLIDLVIRSFWAFDDDPPLDRMEFRRIRRYLNWYWQQVRIEYSETRLQMAAILARKPVIEIAGLESSVESRRYYASLKRLDPLVGLELALVLDKAEELWRIASSPTVPLTELVAAFREARHTDIRQLFRQIFEHVSGSKHPLPAEADVP